MKCRSGSKTLLAVLLLSLAALVIPHAASAASAGNRSRDTTDWVRQSFPAAVGHPRIISFVDADHGWLARKDTLLSTADGGVTWNEIALSDDVYWVEDLAFADRSHGWMLTSGRAASRLATSSDAGATWTVLDFTVDGTGIESIACSDAAHCWVVCHDGSIYATSDGGATWSMQTKADTSWRDATFADGSRGWAVGSPFGRWESNVGTVPSQAIIATTDGGRSWSPQGPLAGYGVYDGFESMTLQAVSFADAAHGCAVGFGYEYAARASVPLVFRTADGGVTWTRCAVPAGTPLGLTGVGFTDASHGWVVGDVGTVLVTSDGGVTWSRRTLQPVTNLLQTASAGGHAWAIGADGAIFTSVDSGSAWSVQALPADTLLKGVAFPDATHGWVVGDFQSMESDEGFGADVDRSASVILRTGDGGASWTLQASPPDVRDIEAVKFVDATHGWAVGRGRVGAGDEPGTPAGWVPLQVALYGGAIVATTDGGATWKAQAIPSGVGGLSDVDFVDASNGWAVGYSTTEDGQYRGEVVATSNGGTTWTRQSVPAGVGDVRRVDFVDAGHGWAVTGSVVLATSDGGATWTIREFKGFEKTIDGVSFADTRHGLLVGRVEGDWNDRTLTMRTADGGENWDVKKLGVEYALLDAELLDAERGWAVGEYGIAYVTTDGGADWSEQTVPKDTGRLVDVDIVDGSHGWAVGPTDLLALTQGTPPGTDTVAPVTKAYATAVKTGRTARLTYQIVDPAPTGGKAKVTLKILRGATEVETIEVGTVACNVKLTYAWKCTLAAGTYTFKVYATDLAGNAQSKAGSARLVVRR